jgi:peptidoglycan/LPS O-acetylase OafA/YrhL
LSTILQRFRAADHERQTTGSSNHHHVVRSSFFGLFVGFLLVNALYNSKKIRLRATITLIGAALGGVPIFFINGLSYARWMYPIGLVLGMLPVSIVGAQTKGPNVQNLIIWFDLVVIGAVTGSVIACATFAGAGPLKLPWLQKLYNPRLQDP